MSMGLDVELWEVVRFSIGVSVASVFVALVPGIGFGWLLAKRRWWGKVCLETLLTLPMVLPPVAVGVILLQAFGRNGLIGNWCENWLGVEFIFAWPGCVLAASVMAFPLIVKSVRAAFEEVPIAMENVARSLGASEWHLFWTVTLPLARRGVLAGGILGFARALGEFGATIMLAGYMPGKTVTLSTEIYHLVQMGQEERAMKFILISISIAFCALWLSEMLGRKK